MTTAQAYRNLKSASELSRVFVRSMRAPRLRTMAEFAESVIVIPDGPYRGRRFRLDRQPWAALWFSEIDSGLWQRYVATGPSQSGKTLCCYVIPTMYHLFEIGETVICGVPKMEMARDKWEQDFLPAIRASRYADLLPDKGKGSRGGSFDAITFRNGSTLKFMTGGGDDKSRAGFTSRVVVVTEVDGLDKSSELSREADPITQLEARTRAYGSRRRIYLECTVSTEEGRIWQEYTNGTKSRIALPCPHCYEYVTPEREHFIGWDGASSSVAAESLGKFFCPACATAWSEDQRRTANENGRLIHERTETHTLGFRWSAVNNMFLECKTLSSEEWEASQQIDQDNAQKARNQFVWCVPADSDVSAFAELKIEDIIVRQSQYVRGELPPDCRAITIGVDVGKWLLHWTAKAWSGDLHGLTIDYGVVEVHSRELGEDAAILLALRALKETFDSGWKIGNEKRTANLVLIDSGNWSEVVYSACREFGAPYFASKGFGASLYRGGSYHKAKNAEEYGDGWHLANIGGVDLLEYDADAWKSRVHSRLECKPENAGAIQLFKCDHREHISYAKHLTAERKVIEFKVGRGVIETWEKIRKANHWLDTEMLANLAADCYGVSVVPVTEKIVTRSDYSFMSSPELPDGRPFLISER